MSENQNPQRHPLTINMEMKIPSLRELFRSKLLLAGLLFIGVNLCYSHLFYQVNSAKIALVLLGVSIIAVWSDLIFPGKTNRKIPWKEILIVALPLLATLPGYLWYQGAYNYNFRYELTSNLILIVWIAYLLRGVQEKGDLEPFFFLIGITVIYVGFWAFGEKFGYHPLQWGGIPPARVKSTFGNINYFAGFLVVLIPLLLALCLPEKLPKSFSLKRLIRNREKAAVFYSLVFLIALISMILTKTRAAQAAAMISLIVVVFFYLVMLVSPKWQKRILIAGAMGVLAAGVVVVMLFSFSEYLPENRYTLLFTIQGWTPRFVAWMPAITAITASPWIGYGLGSSYNLYFAFVDPNARLISAQRSYNHVHSEYLEYAEEAGLIGLAAYLICWGYLVFLLLKTIRSDRIDPLYRRLAIGILGGFIGYHVHAAFSVAPRMMVVKFPLFTLIALTFIVARLSESKSDWNKPRSFQERLIFFLPAGVVLVYAWLMFTPWLIGQYKFVAMQKERPSLMKVEKLETMVKDYPDVYALDYLSHLQIQYRRAPQLQETIELIDKTLPHYRELGYKKSVLALLQQDMAKAKAVALEFQEKRDRYYISNIMLLIGLAFDTSDFELFKDQFRLYLRTLIYKHNLFFSLDPSDTVVTYGNTNLPFEIEQTKNRFSFRWNERLMLNFFNSAQRVRAEKSFLAKERSTFETFLAFHFSRHPFFQLKIKEVYLPDAADINQKANEYLTLSQQKQNKSAELAGSQQNQLLRTNLSARPALEKKHRAEREEAFKPYDEQLAEMADYLSERSDWDAFMKKRGFANSFIREFVTIVYPHNARK